MKIGTVGTNFIVDTFIEAAKQTGKAGIGAVYSRNAETAAEFAKKHGVQKSYADRGAFLNDGDLDFIYVAAPNSLHYQWTLDALNAGRNVICEKPFVSNSAELKKIVKTAEEKKLFLFEALTVPHLPNFRLIREKLPFIGKIRLVQLNFSQRSSRYDAFLAGKNPNLFNAGFSGGALMDLNYYNLCFVQRLFGEPGEIRYFANKAENGIDTSGVLILKYEDFIAEAAATKDSDSKNFVQIQGEGGYIYSDSTASSLRTGFSVITKKTEEHFNLQETENVLYYELLDFIEAYTSGNPGVCFDAGLNTSLNDSLSCALLMDRARKDSGVVFPADRSL
ncbi:MAG: Gfo/Idh/MocA family oxidoreductase [Treponema sp.]|jgi:predicted dehydrogenase|nr:Gfo/Idh/MocA family oxidoreductase [Treponema sp.]